MALRGTLTHRKTRRLSRVLGIDPCYALGLLESLWHVTAEQTPDGAIGQLSNQDIADEMFYGGDADLLISALIESGYLDAAERFRLVVHDWNVYADQSVKRKIARHRKGFASRDGTWLVMASSPETVTRDSNQRQRKKETTSPKKVAPLLAEVEAYALERFTLNSEFAQLFWEHYENTGWTDNQGKPVTNWKNKMRVWVDRRSIEDLAKYKPKPVVDNSAVHR